MANGDISIEQARGLLAGRPTEEQLAFIYQAIINQSHTCSVRQSSCDERYVKKDWIRTKIAFLGGGGSVVTFLGGYTVLRLLGILP